MKNEKDQLRKEYSSDLIKSGVRGKHVAHYWEGTMESGKSISEVEVMNISAHGLWLLVRDRELFLSYEDFPWFKDQPVKSIVKLEEQSPGHFYWPDIDVDLTEEMIEHPERFPLTAKTS